MLCGTGLLPSDIGAPSHRCAQQAATAADADADSVEVAGDSSTATAAITRAGKATRCVRAATVAIVRPVQCTITLGPD